MAHVFTYPRRVGFAETDMAGIAHYSRFLIWMEEAEHAYLRSLGLSVVHRTADGGTVSWPRVSVSCDYSRPARFEDVVEVRVAVEKRGTKSLTYGFTFVGPDGAELARGRTTCVCCRVNPGHGLASIAIPPEFDALRPAAPDAPPDGEV
jgi:YbgC/YbaW family acyl-CoA thioester hydrolase